MSLTLHPLCSFSISSDKAVNYARSASFKRCNKWRLGVRRNDFPAEFVFGVSSASAQYEGASDVDGREESIWDKWCTLPDKIKDGSDCKTTMQQYQYYETDVSLMKTLGVNAYRLSISWSRLFPDGKVNPDGLAYYNNLISELLVNGIKPFVTIYHWDLPQSLQDTLEGWKNKDIIQKYVDYANICFAAFGDRVKHWITFNEPYQAMRFGYAIGTWPPGETSNTEVYVAAHNMLLAHAAAVELYRRKYKPKHKGQIGITLDCAWCEAEYTSPENVLAAERAVDFQFGWFLSPIVHGYYPQTMRDNVGSRLPTFDDKDIQKLKGSIDFLGLNYYTSFYVKDGESKGGFMDDARAQSLEEVNGVRIGPKAFESSWLSIVPWGFYKLLIYIKNEYKNIPVFVTENGFNNSPKPVEEQVADDSLRIQYILSHYKNMEQAIRDGAAVKGHFIWSLLDCWEWTSGYTNSFGLYHVDRNTQKRTPKQSAEWLTKWLSLPK